MATEVPKITERQLSSAAANYIKCLALPPRSQVLVVTDRLPNDSNTSIDPNIDIRIRMASRLITNIGTRFPIKGLWLTDTTKEEFHDRTSETLRSIEDFQRRRGVLGERITTVIYIGDAWANRGGMYEAIDKFCETKLRGSVRVAGSLGFTTGDARVMSKMDDQARDAITKSSDYFRNFFSNHPVGELAIETKGESGPYELTLNYDTSVAPFETELGRFDPENPVFVGNFVYVNIPGGETFATPYPFKKSAGLFTAEGMVFMVKNGMVEVVEELTKGAMNELEETSKSLVRLVQGGRRIPVSELGLGFYALAGISTYPDSSILSREKGGPHIGMGHGFESPEENEIAKKSGKFYHTDFILDNPVITYKDPNTGESKQFYPPIEKN